MKNLLLSIGILFISGNVSFSQVGIGTAMPDKSSVLDLTSTSKGFLPPRMLAADKDNIQSPVKGLMIYQTDGVAGLYVYNGTGWVIATGGAIGNYVDLTTVQTIAAKKIFTKDLEVNGVTVGLGPGFIETNTVFGKDAFLDNITGDKNSMVGFNALIHNTTGTENVAVGTSSLFNNKEGSFNVSVGSQSLFGNTTGTNNTALGSFALKLNTIGNNNTALGHEALYFNNSGHANVATGLGSLYSNKNGNGNNAFGFYALHLNTTGNSNVAIGNFALYVNTTRSNLVAIGDSALMLNGTGATLSTHSKGNTALGSKALYGNTTGYSNTAAGNEALKNNDEGFLNTANGFQSLTTNVDGNYNTALGSQSLYSNKNATSNTAIGFQSLYTNLTGNYNTANGFGSLYFNSVGSGNTASGYQSLLNTTNNYNTGIGHQSLVNNNAGIGNTAIGYYTLATNTGGSSNTGIGNKANVSLNNLINATAIGANASVGCSNCLVLGSINGENEATSSTKVGIGISSPLTNLHINPNGPGSILVGFSKAPGAITSLEMGVTALIGGAAYIRATKPSITEPGKLSLNGNGGNVGINHADPGSIGFPLDINQTSNFYGLRLRNMIDGTARNWDIYAYSNLLNFAWNGTLQAYIGANGSFVTVSDARLKKNITTLENVMDKVMGLKPKNYQYINSQTDGKKVSGFLAQDVLPLFPDLVSDFEQPAKDSNDKTIYHGINYSGFGVIAIKAIQEQQEIITSQNDRIAILEKQVALLLKK